MSSEKTVHFHACQMASSNSVKQHKLRKLIAQLSEKKGPKKDFVSLYIPQEKSADEMVAFLKEKTGSYQETSNSIKNIIQHLKLKGEIEENGMAVFAGADAVNVEEVAPPEPIVSVLFEVDDHFHLEPLREMLRNQKIVGLIALDSKEASFGVLNGERYEYIGNITSGIHGKSGKGGSSQRRYERERDMAVVGFFHRVAEHAEKTFLVDCSVNVLIVGGTGTTKGDFLKGDFLHYELQNSLLKTVDTQSASKEAVREALDKSCEDLKNMCAPEERRIVQRLLTSMGKEDGYAIYGLDTVLKALKKGEVEVALVTDDTDIVEEAAVCKRCGQPKTAIINRNLVQPIRELISAPCTRCGTVDYETSQKDIVDVLEDLATQTKAGVEVISTESPEKAQLTALSGFAALLRFKSK